MDTKLNVLIADADEHLAVKLAQYLRGTGNINVVDVVKDGQTAFDAMIQSKPDLLLLDLVLPGRDGLSVMEGLSQIDCNTCIVVTSALDNSNMITYACQLGADYYICKPYDCKTVYERIQQLCGRYYKVKQDKPQEELPTAMESSKITKKDPENAPTVFTLEAKVTAEIRALGIPAHIKGYQYIREGIILALGDEDMLDYITKFLYPTIAKKYNTTAGSVERAIRHAIGVAWERGNREAIIKLYGYTYCEKRERPTNSEFLSLIVDKLRLEQITQYSSEMAIAM